MAQRTPRKLSDLVKEKTFGTARAFLTMVCGYASNGLPDADTRAAIDYLIAQGIPSWAIQWRNLGEQSGSGDPATVTLTPAPGSTIIYTLDGSDPLDYVVTHNGEAVFYEGELVTIGDLE